MKKILIIVIGVALVASAVPATVHPPEAQAAYLYLQTCREALHGANGDNEVAEGRTWLRGFGDKLTDAWAWKKYVRYSSNRISQYVAYRMTNGYDRQVILECGDANASGALGINEDWGPWDTSG